MYVREHPDLGPVGVNPKGRHFGKEGLGVLASIE